MHTFVYIFLKHHIFLRYEYNVGNESAPKAA